MIRETFAAALRMGDAAMRALSASDLQAQNIVDDVHPRDSKRLALVLDNIDYIALPRHNTQDQPEDSPA